MFLKCFLQLVPTLIPCPKREYCMRLNSDAFEVIPKQYKVTARQLSTSLQSTTTPR
jgi:hypothetical protein